MYLEVYGIPDSALFVLHTCDNPCCCNPDHLKLGTPKENMEDMKLKGRSLSGVRNPKAKLTKEQIVEIQTSSFSYGKTKELAEKFQVSSRTIYLTRKKQYEKET